MFDFINVKLNGKIVMKLFEDGSVSFVNVWICLDDDDVMFVINLGCVIWFLIIDVWVFNLCNLIGVCGIKFNGDDVVVLMLIICYFEVDL